MQRRTCARTRPASRWWTGRMSRSIDLSARKARSTRARLLYARTVAPASPNRRRMACERVEILRLNRGAQHVEAVERRLGGDRRRVAGEAARVLGDGEREVLGDLAPPSTDPALSAISA